MNGLSVVICTYNGSETILDTIKSIVIQYIPFQWEIIVVDNNSNDNTAKVCEDYLKKINKNFNWKILNEKKQGLSYARICGIRESLYDYILFCDDDNILKNNYINVGFKLISSNQNIGALGGRGVPKIDINKPKWFDKYFHSYAVGPQYNENGIINQFPAELYGAGVFILKKPLLFYLNNGFTNLLSGRTEQILLSGEDVEWCYLLQLKGYKIAYNDQLVFDHYLKESRLTWDYYLRLKGGISFSYAAFLMYKYFFQFKKRRKYSFIIYFYLHYFIVLNKYYLFLLKKYFRYYSKEDSELGYVIFKNKKDSFKHFYKKNIYGFVILKSLLAYDV